jgi:FtsP/CotA-like multicopper oxidase with cupredoxin domain
LSVTLEFGHVVIPKERTGLKGELHLLGFNVPGSPGRSPGPTLRVCAGDTLKILLKNNMPPELVSTASSTKNGYHDFSVVNLCTRTGFTFPLWRRPTRSWRRPCAQTRRTPVRVYHIPDDHMGGTHWYHPHWHGAVSIHVNFGAAWF